MRPPLLTRALAWNLLLTGTAGAAASLGPPAPVAAVAPSQTGADGASREAIAADPAAADWFATRPRVDRAVSPAEAAALALEHSPVLAAMRQDVEMARQMLAMARARTAPMLGFNAWATWGDASMIVSGLPGAEPAASRVVPGGASLDANFMAMVPIFTGGRLGAQANAARSRLQATQHDLQAMRLDMAVQVLTMARRLLTMRGMIEVARELVRTTEERLRLDQAAYQVGRVPLATVLRNEAELAGARQTLANQERDYRVMLADLKAMLGVHPLSALEIASPPEDLAPTPATTTAGPSLDPADVASDLDAAARQRPELAGARARIRSSQHDLSAASGAFLPQVSLFGMADFFANRMNDLSRWEEFTVGVGVSLPLFDGGMRSAQVRRARAEQARLTAQEQDAALRVASEVAQAHERLAAARTNVATARASLGSGREDYRLMQLRYQAGLAVNVEVLDALRMRTMAEVNYLTAVQELAIAGDQRRRAIGDPSLLTGPAAAATPPVGLQP